jgi:hypothetical protein
MTFGKPALLLSSRQTSTYTGELYELFSIAWPGDFTEAVSAPPLKVLSEPEDGSRADFRNVVLY